MNILDALTATGLAASKGEARRKLAESAVRLDGDLLTDPTATLNPTTPARLTLGKKKHATILPA